MPSFSGALARTGNSPLNTPRLQILLVEQRHDDALLLQRMLRHAPEQAFDVFWVDSAKDALGWLAQNRADGLVINLD